jgi:DnaJ-class molecular chaperone
MERKTYYAILGVTRMETPRGIRAAYRDLAKKLHPDVAGDEATPAFQEVTEAYTVLSDPERRRDYNHRLRRAEDTGAAVALWRQPVVRQPMDLVADPEGVTPSFEAMHERLLRNFTGIGIPKSERLESLSFEVLLTPDEAANGCVVPIGVPVFYRCPQCGGSGRNWLYPCVQCHGQGMIESERLVHVRTPPMVPSGTVYEIPLGGLGIHNFYLRLIVVVQPDRSPRERW